MFSRRIIMAMLSTVLVLAAGAAPAAAARPVRPSVDERPLTPREEAAADRKIAAADAYIASVEAQEAGLVSLACVSPASVGTEVASGTEAPADEEASAETDANTQGCYVPQGFLGVEARDQIRGHYCGPAVGQVIANYSWAMPYGANKYAQTTIARWMGTDANGGTGAFALEAGLERATGGSPRRPANWDWVVTYLRDRDRDGQYGDQLHDYVRANVSGSKMPLAIPVKPHDYRSRYHLSSWPKPVHSVGHWITAYGWVGLWNGTDSARLYFADSSKDEGGSTGKFWDPTRHIAALIMEHTGRFVW